MFLDRQLWQVLGYKVDLLFFPEAVKLFVFYGAFESLSQNEAKKTPVSIEELFYHKDDDDIWMTTFFWPPKNDKCCNLHLPQLHSGKDTVHPNATTRFLTGENIMLMAQKSGG